MVISEYLVVTIMDHGIWPYIQWKKRFQLIQTKIIVLFINGLLTDSVVPKI